MKSLQVIAIAKNVRSVNILNISLEEGHIKEKYEKLNKHNNRIYVLRTGSCFYISDMGSVYFDWTD